MADIRDQVFLATKTGQRDRERAWAQLNASLERLQADRMDLLQLHAVGDLPELDRATRAGGALQAAVRALRGGVDVVRDYGADVPQIEAYAGELNQVWTNLIDNAVDAMNGARTLRITTRTDGDAVVVELCDSGSGMPPEVAARAFEALYTTKEARHRGKYRFSIMHHATVYEWRAQASRLARPLMLVMHVIFRNISTSRCGCPSMELEVSRCRCPIGV